MRDVYKQDRSALRFDWGLSGPRAVAPEQGCLVVVDVLSFSTTVSVAVSRGMGILPYRWNDVSAVEFAREHDAELAVGRTEMSPDKPWSLSAAALLRARHAERLVLPSPNGSTIAAAGHGTVVTSSLRNGRAVAARLLEAGFGTHELPICVIASGELWSSDDTLRPCLEDLLGAGHVLSALIEASCEPSVEASAAAGTYSGLDDVVGTIWSTASGRELVEDGYAGDVEVAVEIDVDDVVPVMIDGIFIDMSA